MSYQPVALPDRVQLSPEESLQSVQAFADYMRKRHTVREFSDAPVSKDVITACIEAAGPRLRELISSPGISSRSVSLQ